MHPKTIPLVDDHCGEGQLLTRETLRPDLPRRTYFICAEDIFGQLRSGRRATSVDDGDVEEWGQLVEDLSVFDARSEKLKSVGD
jgi:hypothetical protein